MYIIIKLVSYYYYFIIMFFPHERRGLHDPILVQINLISSSSYIYIYIIFYNNTYIVYDIVTKHITYVYGLISILY